MSNQTVQLGNIVAVARRELVTRATTRSFIISTIVLVIAAVLMGLAPVAIGYIDRNTSQTIAVHVGAADLQGDPVATLDAMLNAPTTATGTAAPEGATRRRRTTGSRRQPTYRRPAPASRTASWTCSSTSSAARPGTWTSRST